MKQCFSKVIIVAMVLSLICSCLSCSSKGNKEAEPAKGNQQGTNETQQPKNSQTPDTDQQEATETPSATPEQTPKEEETGTQTSNFICGGEVIASVEYDCAWMNVAFDRPMFQMVSEGFAQVFDSGDYYIMYTYDETVKEGLKAEEVWDLIGNEGLRKTNHYFGGLNGYEMIMESKETVTVNGLECVKFEGKIKVEGFTGEPFEVYSYGYSFAKDNKPNIIMGIVDDLEQKDVDKSEVKHNVDEMIKTVHDSSIEWDM